MSLMQEYERSSALFGGNAPYVEEMYENYLANPGSVPDMWRDYFDALQNVPAVDGSNAKDVPHLPVVNAFAEYRARSTNLEPRLLAGEIWGRYDDGRLVAACHVGANLVPVECTPDDARAFAERALTRPRSVVTIVGPQEQVWPLWDRLSDSWSPPRETRWDQPHMELAGPPAVA